MFQRSADGNDVESKLEEIIRRHSEGFDEELGTLTGLKVKIHMKTEAKPKFGKTRKYYGIRFGGKIKAEL